MNNETIIYWVLMVIVSIGAYCMKEFIFERLNKLEDRINISMTEPEVRQLLSDRLEPIQCDLHELKEKIDQIYTFLIQKGN